MRTWTFPERRPPGDGPWRDEPDGAQWVEQGLDCLLIRHPRDGHWCGYVGVPPAHEWHGRDGERITALIHGGEVTFSGPGHQRFYLRAPGRPRIDDLWWVGFHCERFDDLAPTRAWRDREQGWPDDAFGQRKYRTFAYARDQVAILAVQAADPIARMTIGRAIRDARLEMAALTGIPMGGE